MKIFVKFSLVIVVVLFLFVGCQSRQVVETSSPEKQVCITCENGKSGETVWCASCIAGYVNGDKVKCLHCFEGMSGKRDVWCDPCNASSLIGEKVDCKKCCSTGIHCESCQNKT